LPIRVCHLITDLETGGAERSLVNLVTGMDRSRFDSEVVSLLPPGPMAEPLSRAGIPVATLGMARGRPTAAALLALVRHLRRSRPAILQTWLYHADFLGTLGAALSRTERLIWNIRCTDITKQKTEQSIRWLVRMLAMLSARPDVVVVNSQAGRRDHETLGYHPRIWAEIPNGVDLARFSVRRTERAALRARLGLEADAFVVGLVGRDHPMKDVGTFLGAAALRSAENKNVRFVLCGEGFNANNLALTGEIARMNLQKHVVLLGRRDDVEDIYPAFDVATLCSIYGEGFPNVVCEAMACGVPCVVTGIGDSARIVDNTGVVVPLGDPQAIARAWKILATSGAEDFGDRARARIEANYSLEIMRARYTALYEQLVPNT